jgi:hypothetical protein
MPDKKNQFAIMKTITNLVFLTLFLICGPVFMYYVYTKTYTPGTFQKKLTSPDYQKIIQEKNYENQRLQKELEELKKHKERPLAQPARRFGQGGGQSTNPTSQSPLSQPPRRVGQPATPSVSDQHQENESMDRQIKPAYYLNEKTRNTPRLKAG